MPYLLFGAMQRLILVGRSELIKITKNVDNILVHRVYTDEIRWAYPFYKLRGTYEKEKTDFYSDHCGSHNNRFRCLSRNLLSCCWHWKWSDNFGHDTGKRFQSGNLFSMVLEQQMPWSFIPVQKWTQPPTHIPNSFSNMKMGNINQESH
mgnify:CR=1 FL=1